jgi:hypothetical protein
VPYDPTKHGAMAGMEATPDGKLVA